MSPDQVIRAWKDTDYGAGLGPDAAVSLPANPVGSIDLADAALGVAGGSVANTTEYVETLGCCQGFTQVGKCDVTVGYPYCTVACLTIAWTRRGLC